MIRQVVFAAIAVGLIYLLYRLLRKVPRLIARIKQFLSGVLGGVDRSNQTGYVDKKESLLELRDTPRLFLSKARNWLKSRRSRERTWAELQDNAERVRYLFRTAMRHAVTGGFRYQRERTPLENAEALGSRDKESPEAALALARQYNAVRYGERIPPDAEVEELARRFLKNRS